ncbi:GntR family transcriptional regulator [Enterococcus xiangfangensis]|uniref:GntR family transcriptional regulator n=1 Tax=Enterococcus xiangfangensis TaxID=1296537 RepID=UPI0010F6FB1B|nr:GntR family transcriptional regulator [Enterococcus xiangfangensis]MBM7711185.1 GntR family transcriptional regulator [Enterococcus xiangfangensis]NBK09247.1 GntR family transcriptional regulator [Enterococcus asini]
MKVPLHKKIRINLLEKIQNGEYVENQLIPTEMELAEEYNVSRPTIRQAVQSLVDEGYLEKRKKRGTIVKKNKIQQEFTHVIESFDLEMNRKGILPKTKVLNFQQVVASEEVAENLELNQGDAVYKLTRLRYAEEKPVVLVTSYIPFELFPNFQQIDFTKEKMYQVFKEMGHPIKTVTRKLEVIKADETISDLLDVAEGDPMFYFHTQGFSENHVPIEYSISKYRGDINYFVFELAQ